MDPDVVDSPDPVADAWEVLCARAIRLGRALAEYDDGVKRYLATNPYRESQ